jgi:hypothetical protein
VKRYETEDLQQQRWTHVATNVEIGKSILSIVASRVRVISPLAFLPHEQPNVCSAYRSRRDEGYQRLRTVNVVFGQTSRLACCWRLTKVALQRMALTFATSIIIRKGRFETTDHSFWFSIIRILITSDSVSVLSSRQGL